MADIILTTIPTDQTGGPLARESEREGSAPRDLRSLLLQALANAPLAGWMQVAQDIRRPMPDDPRTINERSRLYDRIEHADRIDVRGDELALLEKCVAAEFTVGAVQIFRAMHRKDS